MGFRTRVAVATAVVARSGLLLVLLLFRIEATRSSLSDPKYALTSVPKKLRGAPASVSAERNSSPDKDPIVAPRSWTVTIEQRCRHSTMSSDEQAVARLSSASNTVRTSSTMGLLPLELELAVLRERNSAILQQGRAQTRARVQRAAGARAAARSKNPLEKLKTSLAALYALHAPTDASSE